MKKPAGLAGMGIAAAVAAAWLLWKLPWVGREALIASNEAAAIEALRAVHAAELEFRRNDGDGNGVPDFWAADVSGLCRAAQPNGDPCGFLDPALAAADRSPLPSTDGPRPRLTALLPAKDTHGYWLHALRGIAADGPDDDDRPWENLRRFAFAAVPAAPGVSGRRAFLVGEDGVVWTRDAGAGAPDTWPAKGPEAEGWKRAQ